MVEYLVLLELPFSTQLEEEYEKVKVALKEELQNVSQDGDNCQNDQGEQRLGAWGWREGSGSQPPSQPAPAHTGAYGGQVSALRYLRQDRRGETGPQKPVKGEPKEGLSEPRSCGRESCSRSPGWPRTPGSSGDMREAQGAFLHGPSKPRPY